MAKINVRVMTITLDVTVPATISENEVATAINAALDEGPCEWGDWTVGIASVAAVRRDKVEAA